MVGHGASAGKGFRGEERFVSFSPNDIAIIGMSCVFPGAGDARRYWQNILDKVDSVSDAPPDWEAERFFEADGHASDRTYCKRGGFLGDLSAFDPSL